MSESVNEIRFYTADFYELDNWSAHQIFHDGCLYPTAEHMYHAQKFVGRADLQDRICRARSPRLAKGLARQHASDVRADWSDVRLDAMRMVLQLKSNQHEDVENALIRSEGLYLVENSPEDSFWGSAPDGSGSNWLGRLWMEVRGDLT